MVRTMEEDESRIVYAGDEMGVRVYECSLAGCQLIRDYEEPARACQRQTRRAVERVRGRPELPEAGRARKSAPLSA